MTEEEDEINASWYAGALVVMNVGDCQCPGWFENVNSLNVVDEASVNAYMI